MLRQEQMPVGSNPTARHFFFLPFHSNTSALAGGVVAAEFTPAPVAPVAPVEPAAPATEPAVAVAVPAGEVEI